LIAVRNTRWTKLVRDWHPALGDAPRVNINAEVIGKLESDMLDTFVV